MLGKLSEFSFLFTLQKMSPTRSLQLAMTLLIMKFLQLSMTLSNSDRFWPGRTAMMSLEQSTMKMVLSRLAKHPVLLSSPKAMSSRMFSMSSSSGFDLSSSNSIKQYYKERQNDFLKYKACKQINSLNRLQTESIINSWIVGMSQPKQQPSETKKSEEDLVAGRTESEQRKEEGQEKKQNNEGEPEQAKKEKTVTLTVKEMNKIRKQLQKMETAKKENEELRNYIKALEKKMEENKKAETSKQAMEETIKHLQRMVDESSKNEERAKREEAKYKEIYKHEKEMLASLKLEVEELRKLSSEYFLLKQEVSRLNNECISLREARDEHPKILKKNEELETSNEQLRQALEDRRKELQGERELKEKLEAKLQSVLHANKELGKEKNKMVCEKEELQGELDAVKQQLEDERMDQQVREKKTLNEIKQLKVTLHQEHEKLKITEHQLEEARKNVKQAVDLDKVKLSSLGKEDLFNLLEESEMKIVSLKMALDEAGLRIQEQGQKLKEKDQAVMALARELTRDYPNLDESEGMEYVEKDIIEMGKLKKEDWGEIVEKVMIENLRLKSSVTALGEEYNSMMRQKK